MTSAAEALAPAPSVRPKVGRDDWIMRAYMLVIVVYLLVALAFPLYAMMSKSFETFAFRFDTIEFQVDRGEGWGETLNALELGTSLGVLDGAAAVTSADGRF